MLSSHPGGCPHRLVLDGAESGCAAISPDWRGVAERDNQRGLVCHSRHHVFDRARVRTGLRRAAFTVTLRNHWLTLTVWLLPLASLIGVGICADQFCRRGEIVRARPVGLFPAVVCRVLDHLFNSAFQDGQAEPRCIASCAVYCRSPRWLCWPWWGWPPGRWHCAFINTVSHRTGIWGALVVAVALVYGMGYVLALRAGRETRWMLGIAPANIVASLIMSAGIALLLSPALDANRLATDSQMARLQSGQVQADDFDVWALSRQERAGHDALAALGRQRGVDGKPSRLALRAGGCAHNANRYRGSEFNEKDEVVAVLRADRRFTRPTSLCHRLHRFSHAGRW